MFRRAIVILAVVSCFVLLSLPGFAADGQREFPVASGGKLVLDLQTGGSVEIRGTGGSAISVRYTMECSPECEIEFSESGEGLEIATRFAEGGRRQSSDVELEIEVPRYFDVDLDSMGGGLSIDGVEGRFTGKTMGGELTLHDVRGEAKLKTMGGEIRLTDSELDGKLETMGGRVLFENVLGDVEGSSMGGNVRYKNVQRRDGLLGSPARTGDELDEITAETVQISTMGGAIEIEDAPEGADLHTMGGDINVVDAVRFVRAKTMGGDIRIESVDGWVEATTMGGDVDVEVTGGGGDLVLKSMTGDIVLVVPAGFGMDLDLEIAFTRNSRKEYRIDAPGIDSPTVTPEWDHDHGTPRKYVRGSSSVNGGGNAVKISTVNGTITVREGG